MICVHDCLSGSDVERPCKQNGVPLSSKAQTYLINEILNSFRNDISCFSICIQTSYYNKWANSAIFTCKITRKYSYVINTTNFMSRINPTFYKSTETNARRVLFIVKTYSIFGIIFLSQRTVSPFFCHINAGTWYN